MPNRGIFISEKTNHADPWYRVYFFLFFCRFIFLKSGASKRASVEPTEEFTPKDIYIFTLGLKQFGTDFAKISEILQTKTAEMLAKFYHGNKTRFSFDKYAQEFESQKKKRRKDWAHCQAYFGALTTFHSAA